MKTIAENGRDGFYRGEIADKIISFSDAHGGLLTLDDLAGHASEWVEPLGSQYRGYDLFEIPPNGQGITAQIALNILAQTDVAQYVPLGADHVHLLSEAFTLAIAERDRFVSDPKYAKLPVEHLLSAEFARAQFERIDMERALPQPVQSALPNHQDTVYLSVVDKDRNACSFINSTFYSWGSGLVAGNTGIVLHNRGSGFSLDPNHFNRIEPGKRPMHTIIPAMLYRDAKPVLCFGVMGAHYQAMGQSYVLSNWIDYGMDIQQAIDAHALHPCTTAYSRSKKAYPSAPRAKRWPNAAIRSSASNPRTAAARPSSSTGMPACCTAAPIRAKTVAPRDIDMQAITLKEFGGPEVMQLSEVETPAPGDGQLLIKVMNASVNRPDVIQREGNYPPPPGDSEILGLEVAGTVESVGAGVTRYQPGDRVFALVGGGGYAEYCVAYESHCMPVPQNLDFAQAACICETYITAYLNLFIFGEVQDRTAVLIHGGGGGVATAGIQLCKALTPETTIFVTASSG